MDSTTVPVSSVDNEKGYTTTTATRPPRSKSPLHTHVLVFRYLTFAATLAAFCIMITNKQKKVIPFLGTRWAKYHYSDAFMWFVIANCIAFIYTLLTALFTTFTRSSKFSDSLLLFDLLVTYIILSGAAAATAVAYIGKNGLSQSFWPSLCDTYKRYCAHVLGALITSFLGWLFLTTGVILSSLQRHRI